METVFLELLRRSMAAALLIAAVLVLRAALRRAPKWTRCLLWAAVALRLLLPAVAKSPVSAVPEAVGGGELVERWTERYAPDSRVIYAGAPGYDAAVGAGRTPAAADGGADYVVTAADGVSAPETVGSALVPALSRVWLVGAALLLLYAGVSWLRLRRKMRVSAPVEPGVYVCDAADTPFILGIFAPKIYLPSGLPEAQRAPVLAHERAHLARRDHWWKPLGWLLLAVYWFNPLMWLAYVLLCRDIELACDERVVRELDLAGRKAYSLALLDCGAHRRLVLACPLAFGEVGVKERVKNVLNYRKPAFWLILLALLAAVAAGVLFLTDRESAEEEPTETVEPTARVDEEALAACSGMLFSRMMTATALNLGYESYDTLQFYQLHSLHDGADEYTVYYWEPAFHVADPASLVLAGGAYLDDEGRVRGAEFSPFLVVKNGGPDYRFLGWESGLGEGSGSTEGQMLTSIRAAFEEARSFLGALTVGCTLPTDLPAEVLDKAESVTAWTAAEWNATGGVSGWRVEAAEISALERVCALPETGLEMYRLAIRLKPDRPENVVLVGGQQLEDGWLSRLDDGGDRFLIFERRGGRCVYAASLSEQTIVETAEVWRARYGDAYTGACMDTFLLSLRSHGGDAAELAETALRAADEFDRSSAIERLYAVLLEDPESALTAVAAYTGEDRAALCAALGRQIRLWGERPSAAALSDAADSVWRVVNAAAGERAYWAEPYAAFWESCVRDGAMAFPGDAAASAVESAVLLDLDADLVPELVLSDGERSFFFAIVGGEVHLLQSPMGLGYYTAAFADGTIFPVRGKSSYQTFWCAADRIGEGGYFELLRSGRGMLDSYYDAAGAESSRAAFLARFEPLSADLSAVTLRGDLSADAFGDLLAEWGAWLVKVG